MDDKLLFVVSVLLILWQMKNLGDKIDGLKKKD